MNLLNLINLFTSFILLCFAALVSNTLWEFQLPPLSVPKVQLAEPVSKVLNHSSTTSVNSKADFPVNAQEKINPYLMSLSMDELTPGVFSGIQDVNQFITKIVISPPAMFQLVLARPFSMIPATLKIELIKNNTIDQTGILFNHSQLVSETNQTNPAGNSAENIPAVETITNQGISQGDSTVLSNEPPSIGGFNAANLSEELSEKPNIQTLNENFPNPNGVFVPPVTLNTQTQPSNSFQIPQDLSALPSYKDYHLQAGFNPLTGLAPESPGNLDRRPVMVKIANFPRFNRPHAGLSVADIVFEYYVGDDMNNFLGVFYGNDSPQIGPIGSGNLADIQLANLYQGIFSYGDTPPAIDSVINNELGFRALPHWKCPSPAVYKIDDQAAGIDYGSSTDLSLYSTKNYVQNKRFDLSGMIFDEMPPPIGAATNQIGIEYSYRNRGEWHYDPTSRSYQRWIENSDNQQYTMEPLMDRLDNSPIMFSNVIVLFTQYTGLDMTNPDFEIISGNSKQRALIFRDGLLVDGFWSVTSPIRPIQLSYQNGSPAALKPGNSWMIFVGSESSTVETSPGVVEVSFSLP